MAEIYKYREWNTFSRQIIEHGELYFAPPSWFNDPFEFRPYLDHFLNPDDLYTFIGDGIKRLLHDVEEHAPPEEATRVKGILAQLSAEQLNEFVQAYIPNIVSDPNFTKELTEQFSIFRKSPLKGSVYSA